MAQIPVKFFSSRRSGGAGTLSGSTSALANILRQCLVTGFNSKAVISITVAGTTATMVCTAHGFLVPDVIALSNANEPAFNGDWRVTSVVDANTLTFTVPGGLPSSATGSITAKYSPCGWTEEFTNGTTKAVFRNDFTFGSGYRLRVADDGSATGSRSEGARGAWFGMAETATGLDTWDRIYQVLVQKSSTADGTARHWFLVGDGKRFYLGIEWSGTFPTLNYIYTFGDIQSFRAADVHGVLCCGLSAQYGANTDDPGLQTYNTYEQAQYFDGACSLDFQFNKATGMALGRGYHQVGGFVTAMMCGSGFGGYNRQRNSAGGALPPGTSGVSYPNAVDNSLLLSGPAYVLEITNYSVRGICPGVRFPLHQIRPANDLFLDVMVEGTPRNIWVAQTALTYGNLRGEMAFDLTGPWE